MSIKLGEICRFQSGGTPAKGRAEYFNGIIPWITTTALNGGMIDESNAVDWITDKAITESSAKIVPAYSIMVGTRVGVGKVAVNVVDMSTNQDIISLIDIDESVWNKDFLCKCIQGKSSFLNTQARGATIKGIKIEVLADLEIPDISLEKQRHISHLINSISQVISVRRHQLAELDVLVKARFVEMFGNPVLNDKGWEQRLLGEITTKIGSGATPKGGKEAYQEEGITLIRSMNVHNGQFEYKDLAHISNEQASKLDNVTIEDRDVLLNITGASVARSCVVPREVLPARVNQHVCIIRCRECIIPEFLNILLIDDNYQDLLWSIAGSGATREAITKQQVENLLIILPPMELQKEFMQFCKQVTKSKIAIQKALDEAQILFDSLMKEYFG